MNKDHTDIPSASPRNEQNPVPGPANSLQRPDYVTNPEDIPGGEDSVKEGNWKKRSHWIKVTWLRRTLKSLMWIVLSVIFMVVLLYVPPVQDFVKNVACGYVYKSTGMRIQVDRFRLRFPLNLSLQGVTVLDQHADTMVNAREVIADVDLRPLLSLDVRPKKLSLVDGYYRMVSPDSSMILSVRAGRIDADDKSFANLRTSEINLNKAVVKDGDLRLFMNVWKQKPTPPDSASTPFLIKADDLRLENFRFAMSMLPVIDTMYMDAADIALRKGIVDLRSNSITASYLGVGEGSLTYIVPTAEYVKTHPAPVDTIASQSAPMRILADSIALDGFNVVYATKGAVAQPGFDPAYIALSGVAVGMRNFYNEASTVNLPLTRLSARERSGLFITEGSGFVGVDSTGLTLRDLLVRTPYSSISGTAGLPFALMELNPKAPVDARISATVGMPDVEAFMPAAKTYTSMLPNRNPLVVDLEATGTLAEVAIERLEARINGFLRLAAKGFAQNALDFRKLRASVNIDGAVENTSILDHFLRGTGMKVPAFTIKGKAGADRQTYTADLGLHTSDGALAAAGHVSMNAETYTADIESKGIDVADVLPSLGIGKVYASVKADGLGFDPTRSGARTHAVIDISSVTYQGNPLRDISAVATLSGGAYTLTANSANPNLDIDIDATGTLAPDLYTFDVRGYIGNANLYALGLSKGENGGRGNIFISGSASPQRWLYDADVKISDFEWTIANKFYRIPGALTAHVGATETYVTANIDANMTRLDFSSASGLQRLVAGFTSAADSVMAQVGRRELDFAVLQKLLPPFRLDINASGKGLAGQVLNASGMSLDTVYASFVNDSLLRGDAYARNLNTSSMRLDTLSLLLRERGNLLDYKAHIGNRKGNLDELANVDVNGYVGSNRALASLTQRNVKGETGYRLGFTVAMMDSSVNLHFTPLKATIAYLPWKINLDNHLEYHFNGRINANLEARSSESAIALLTSPGEKGYDELHLNLTNIHIQDFLSMMPDVPPLTATVNSNMTVAYNGNGFEGGGSLSVHDFSYERTRVGDFDLGLNASLDNSGATNAAATLKIDGNDAMTARVRLLPDSVGKLAPEEMGLMLHKFPLSVANAFISKDMAVLNGGISGSMDMTGSFAVPMFNGSIQCDSVSVYIPMSGTRLRFDNEPLVVADNVVKFNDYDIWAMNSNPLTVNGSVNARKFSDISFDITANARNIQLVGSDSRSRTDIYGKLFMNLNASARGPMKHFTVNADATVLNTTDIAYTVQTLGAEVGGVTDADDVVRFVVFSDTLQVAKADSVPQQLSMRLIASLTLQPGMMATVNLSGNGTDKAQFQPSGTLNYYQNYMGDMRLTGTLSTGEGFARYSLPAIGQKMLAFDPQSNIVWSGDIMNPTINVSGHNNIKANVVENGNSRLVDFVVMADVGGTLSAPKLNFDLRAENDISIENQLQSMSADQRSQQAMSLFIYGQYTANGVRTDSGPTTGMLYSYLTGKLNSWAAQNIRGVDLSFGVDQYDKVVDGNNSTTMSYSYQVSKSLFNNRFKISVGGNYSTDASADENFSENLISDISFEYILKQTQNLTMYARLFRHTGYESILEGEITETGVGFVLKRRLATLRHLFRLGRRRSKETADSAAFAGKQTVRKEDADSLINAAKEILRKEERDSVNGNPNTHDNEK